MVCAAADLDQPNPGADPVMASDARQFLETLPKAESGPRALDARKAIYLSLPLGSASIDQIASGLELNVRTLQRRLDTEKTCFSDLVNRGPPRPCGALSLQQELFHASGRGNARLLAIELLHALVCYRIQRTTDAMAN